MKLKTAVLCGLMVFILAGFCLITAKAQSGPAKTVFRIGTFDRSSAEFAGGAPKQPVDFIVGESNPAKDWYAAQPAELVSAMGAHPTNDAAESLYLCFLTLREFKLNESCHRVAR